MQVLGDQNEIRFQSPNFSLSFLRFTLSALTLKPTPQAEEKQPQAPTPTQASPLTFPIHFVRLADARFTLSPPRRSTEMPHTLQRKMSKLFHPRASSVGNGNKGEGGGVGKKSNQVAQPESTRMPSLPREITVPLFTLW